MLGRPGFHSGVRRRFWGQVRSGLSARDASAAVGVSRWAGEQWFSDAGGVMPPRVMSAKVRPRLTFEQREDIAVLLAAGHGKAEIARRVGCHRSTIGRELALKSTTFNDGHRPKYRASTAQKRSDWQARRTGVSKLDANGRLRKVVQDQLEEEHSPEQISARPKIDFPHDAEMRVSHEVIYQALYVQGRGELRRDLHTRLRTGRAIRKTRRSVGERRGKIPDMINIAERPPEVEDRAVPGHWEGDLITGAQNKSAIGTLVERA